MHILDVSDKTKPVETGVFTETNYYNLSVVGDYAYIVRLDELRIIDITDKAHPVGVSLFPMPKSQSGIMVVGDLAYTTGFFSFYIFDVSNKQEPFLVREGLLPSEWAYVFAVTNDYAFFANGQAGMVMAPLSDALTPTIHFSTSYYSASESIGEAAITVTLNSPSVYTVTADYATHNSTAIAGSDYITTSGTLTFTPGITLTNFTVSILDDARDEDSETVILTLSNASQAVIGNNNPVTLTILDDDVPVVQFDAANYTVKEAEGSAIVTVTLDVATWQTVTVNYMTGGGIATAGEDYIAISGTLTFTPGVIVQNIVVSIIADSFAESDETVILILSNATHAIIGDHDSAVLNIMDEIENFTIYLPLVIRQFN